ncbi:MAG: hypothetical protein ACLRP4_04095 [Dialister invisus]
MDSLIAVEKTASAFPSFTAFRLMPRRCSAERLIWMAASPPETARLEVEPSCQLA